jgi:alkylation response protein AidB-like acyl-CoA dehydrogenase
MDFTKPEAAQDLSGLVGTIAEAVCTPQHQRELDGCEQRFDTTLWGKLIDADILSTAAPESVGGGGFGVLEQTAILTALGRQIAAVPYLESVALGAGALARFGSPELRQAWAVPAVAGQKVLTVALDGELGQGPVQATASGGGFRLTGTRTQVPYGPVADAFLVPADTNAGTKVFLVDIKDPGVSVIALRTTGQNSSGELELAGVEVGADRVVGAADVVDWLASTRAVGMTAFQFGVLQRALELTAEYARTREQFDRPIGFFQAVKHPLVDAMVEIDRARSLLYHACAEIVAGSPQAEIAARMAKSAASDAAAFISDRSIQLHGGIGFTWEYGLHIYFKRNLHNQALFGDGVHQRAKLADLLIGPVSTTANVTG